MPAKIDFGEAAEALYSHVRDQGMARVRRAQFFEIMRGEGIASSRDALRTLWAQAKFAEWNVYTGPQDMVVVDVPALCRAVTGGVYIHTYTHGATHTEEGSE